MHIELIGGFNVVQVGRQNAQFPTQRSRLLLAYLAYFRQQPHPRELLAEMLWPGGNPDAIRLRLNQTVAELRRAFGRPDNFLISDRFNIQLDPGISTDIDKFFEQVHLARGQNDPKRLAEAVEMVRGELLPGFYEDWVMEARENFSEILVRALQELSELCEKVGQVSEAIAYLKRALAINHYSDQAHLNLLRLLLKTGRQAEAIKHYESLKATLREDFAIAPNEEIAQLMRPFAKPGTEPAVRSPGHSAVPKTPPSDQSVDYVVASYIGLGDAERAMRLAAVLVQHWNYRGEMDAAYRWLKRAVSLRTAIYAPSDARASALIGLAFAAMSLGRMEESGVALRSALSLSTTIGDQRLIAESSRGIGSLATKQGKYREAQSHLGRSVDLYKRLGDKSGLADALTGLGEAFRFQEDFVSAEAAHCEARKLRLEIGRADRAAQSALNLGILASRRCDYRTALPLLRECLTQVRDVGSQSVVADCLMEIAGVCAETGAPERAAHLLAAAARLRERIQAPISLADRADYARFLRSARNHLTKEVFNRQWETGQAQDLQESIDLALQGAFL